MPLAAYIVISGFAGAHLDRYSFHFWFSRPHFLIVKVIQHAVIRNVRENKKHLKPKSAKAVNNRTICA